MCIITVMEGQVKPDCKKITQVINYLVSKQGGENPVPELKVIKLVWAADRYHLRNYARTVTRDNYIAMKRGPVGSSTKNVAEFETGFGNVEYSDTEYSEKYIKFYQENRDGYLSTVSDVDTSELSKTDIEALDFALKNFGNMETKELIKFTHNYPEWSIHKDKIKQGYRSVEIDLLDFFKNPEGVDNDPFATDPEILKSSKELYEEYA